MISIALVVVISCHLYTDLPASSNPRNAIAPLRNGWLSMFLCISYGLRILTRHGGIPSLAMMVRPTGRDRLLLPPILLPLSLRRGPTSRLWRRRNSVGAEHVRAGSRAGGSVLLLRRVLLRVPSGCLAMRHLMRRVTGRGVVRRIRVGV